MGTRPGWVFEPSQPRCQTSKRTLPEDSSKPNPDDGSSQPRPWTPWRRDTGARSEVLAGGTRQRVTRWRLRVACRGAVRYVRTGRRGRCHLRGCFGAAGFGVTWGLLLYRFKRAATALMAATSFPVDRAPPATSGRPLGSRLPLAVTSLRICVPRPGFARNHFSGMTLLSPRGQSARGQGAWPIQADPS